MSKKLVTLKDDVPLPLPIDTLSYRPLEVKELIKFAKLYGCDAVKFQKRTVEQAYSKEILDSPRDSPWGNTTRDEKIHLEFGKKEYDEINEFCSQQDI